LSMAVLKMVTVCERRGVRKKILSFRKRLPKNQGVLKRRIPKKMFFIPKEGKSTRGGTSHRKRKREDKRKG